MRYSVREILLRQNDDGTWPKLNLKKDEFVVGSDFYSHGVWENKWRFLVAQKLDVKQG